MTANDKKDPSTKIVIDKLNCRKLIDNFANKVNNLIKNCEHACELCNAQYVDTDIKEKQFNGIKKY